MHTFFVFIFWKNEKNGAVASQPAAPSAPGVPKVHEPPGKNNLITAFARKPAITRGSRQACVHGAVFQNMIIPESVGRKGASPLVTVRRNLAPGHAVQLACAISQINSVPASLLLPAPPVQNTVFENPLL